MITEIKFACAHCGQRIAVGSDAAGVKIDCPTCQNSVTIPKDEGSSEPPRKDAGLREKFAALQSECERLRANATSSQAEIRSFQTERLALKQRAAAAETQLSSMERERLESHAALARLADETASALRELAGLRSELAGAVAARERTQIEAAKKHAHFTETATRLSEACAALATAQSELTALQTRFATASSEAESLRGLMNRDEATRELLSTRTKLAAVEDELRMRRQSATQLEIDLLKAEADRDRLDEERGALYRQLAGALKKAESLSKESLHADNAKLRELLDRQNEELKAGFKELTRFRRAKLTLKMVWAFAGLAVIGLGYAFLKILPTIEW